VTVCRPFASILHHCPSLLWAWLLLAVTASLYAQQPALEISQPATPLSGKLLTPAEYASRLDAWQQLVAGCRAAMTASHCLSSQIDPDFQLQLPSGNRQIRLVWLRALLDEAAHPPKSETKTPAKPSNLLGQENDTLQLDQLPSIQERLDAAQKRLVEERSQLLSPEEHLSPASPAEAHRAALKLILDGKDYHAIQTSRSLRERFLEKLQEWILRFFKAISDAGRGNRWIGIGAEVVFIVLLCLALVWFLIRLERQGRYVNASFAPGFGAASARDWQLWLEDARQAAAHGAWRDAVHYLYWSSISRLESSGLWPADRARTPREYLSLLAPGNIQRPALLALTRTFERTWYAGRPATEADYLQAEQQAEQLGARRPDLHSEKAVRA
jgi:hypothetical protein